MQFQTFDYVFGFLPLTLLGYLALRRTRFANLFILLMSLYFYASSAVWYLAPFFFTALIDFWIGQKIFDSADDTYRKRLLAISVIVNLAVLSIFKYTTWLSGSLSAGFAHYGIVFAPFVLALPPGISFYTFQSMSYTIDIKRREFHPYRNVVDYLSFVAFFPHLVAGPMMRARDLLPQLAKQRPLPSASTVAGALFLILFGLFLKVVLADNFGGLVDLVVRQINHETGTLPPGLGLVFTYAFAFQIYCDFAAYSTIARGSARLFGVELMRNFLTPYFSSNPSEFWQRWHISLSTWLRDYLYIPLGGNRHGNLATTRNLLITMFLGGLWHGAGVFFILWGIYHGLLLILYRALPIDKYLIRMLGPRFGRPLAIFLYFQLTCFGWILFRSTPETFGPIVGSIAAIPGAAWPLISAYADALLRPLADMPNTLAAYWPLLVDGGAPAGPTFGELFLAMIARLGQDVLEVFQLAFAGIVATIKLNFAFWLYFYQLLVLGAALFVTDYAGYRKSSEFGDLFYRMPVWLTTVVILALVYGIVLFGRRDGDAFIYFAF